MIPIQYIIEHLPSLPVLNHVEAALQAGCRWIQWRTDEDCNEQALQTAARIKALCRDFDATFVIEGQAELVKAADADGIQLPADGSAAEARRTLGEGFLIGAVAADADTLIRQRRESADYCCVGPVGNGGLSLEELHQAVETAAAQGTTLPVCAFGHLMPEQTAALLEAGARGISLLPADSDLTEEKVKSYLRQYFNA